MNSVLSNIEFFTFECEIWVRFSDGTMQILKESDYDIIGQMVDYIAKFYPKAFAALCESYSRCAPNQSYFRYRMICRFIKCNFGALDSTPDINTDLHCTFEHINCPLRGECKYDHVICHPEFDHKLSTAEKRVMTLVYDGLTEDAIAEHLHLSPKTIHSHVRNAYTRIGIHSKAEFIKYATSHNLFS